MTETATPQMGTGTAGTGSPAAANTATTTQAAPGAASTQQPEVFDREYVESLRKEAASYRTKAKQFEDAQRAAEEAKLGELDKAKKQATEAQAQLEATQGQLKAERAGRAIEKAASRLGLDPELASKLLPAEAVEFDADGVPQDPEKQLKALVAKWPQLVKPAPAAPSINASDGRGPAPAADPAAKDQDLKRRYRIA